MKTRSARPRISEDLMDTAVRKSRLVWGRQDIEVSLRPSKPVNNVNHRLNFAFVVVLSVRPWDIFTGIAVFVQELERSHP